MLDIEASCKGNGKLESALYNLYWLQKEKIELATDFSNYLTRYINKEITYSELFNKQSDLKFSINEIDLKIEYYKDMMNLAILQRMRNESIKNKKYSTRKINGINIKTFREMTSQMFKDVLPMVCSKCGSKDNLTIHHLRYKYPIELKDLVRLCRSCHSKLHKGKKYGQY